MYHLTSDIAQVVAYAEATGCSDALLIYPTPPRRSLDAWIGDIRVRSAVFDLDDDIQDAGQRLLTQILAD